MADAQHVEVRLTLQVRPFDAMIGRLDRLLSEFLLAVDACSGEAQEPDWQTLKHHADDLIGVGTEALSRLRGKRESAERVERGELPF